MVLFTQLNDGDDATANSINAPLTELSDAIGRLVDGTDPLATPDIANFVNSPHNHANAANGGLIPFDNLDTTGATVGQKWVADGAGGGSWISGYPIVSAMAVMARISDDGNRWLRCDGRTIGAATSGGTARANADMEDLFTHLWSEFTNTELVIEDSTGTPTTRGASAAADWAADKRMPLLDMRGRTVVGMDDPTGADPANRVTNAQADILGGSMGAETHTLVESEQASHKQIIRARLNAAAGSSTDSVVATNNTGTTSYIDAYTNASGGGDGAHNNMQPTMFLNYFIYTGN